MKRVLLIVLGVVTLFLGFIVVTRYTGEKEEEEILCI
jgi:general stress protein CsbA